MAQVLVAMKAHLTQLIKSLSREGAEVEREMGGAVAACVEDGRISGFAFTFARRRRRPRQESSDVECEHRTGREQCEQGNKGVGRSARSESVNTANRWDSAKCEARAGAST